MVLTCIRCLCAAPLLPEDLIMEGLAQIWTEIEELGLADILRPLFIDYFNRAWQQRLQELSVYKQPERTNNCSESDNHSMAVEIPRNGPSIYQLLGTVFKSLLFLHWFLCLLMNVL